MFFKLGFFRNNLITTEPKKLLEYFSFFGEAFCEHLW
jgi:hypothetical protein